MNETQVKLMQEYGVLVLPEEINHDAYMLVVEALHFADACGHERVVLYCAGSGGDLPAGLAIADLIGHRGNVVGLLPGQADSCHADVWLACAERYVFPLGCMGIHAAKWTGTGDTLDDRRVRNFLHELYSYNSRVARLLTDASKYGVDYWLRAFDEVGASGFRHYDAHTLIEMQIAKPIRDYPHPLTPSPLRKEGGQTTENRMNLKPSMVMMSPTDLEKIGGMETVLKIIDSQDEDTSEEGEGVDEQITSVSGFRIGDLVKIVEGPHHVGETGIVFRFTRTDLYNGDILIDVNLSSGGYRCRRWWLVRLDAVSGEVLAEDESVE